MSVAGRLASIRRMAAREVAFGGSKRDPSGAALVTRQTFLQLLLQRALQLRVDGRAHRIGNGGDGVDPCRNLGLTRDLVGEVETEVAARLVGGECRQLGQFPAGLLGADCPVFLHSVQHIGEPLLGAARIAVGAVVVRTLGQAGKESAFLERELLGGFAEIALRRHLDAPGAAAEKDEVEIELQDLVLVQRLLEPGRHDHLADLALVGDVVAYQQVLHHLLGDGGAAAAAANRRGWR